MDTHFIKEGEGRGEKKHAAVKKSGDSSVCGGSGRKRSAASPALILFKEFREYSPTRPHALGQHLSQWEP